MVPFYARLVSYIDEATSASSNAAKVQRDLYDWSFLKSCSEVFRDLKNVDSAVSQKGYDLDTLAGYYGVQIENEKKLMKLQRIWLHNWYNNVAATT